MSTPTVTEGLHHESTEEHLNTCLSSPCYLSVNKALLIYLVSARLCGDTLEDGVEQEVAASLI